jgi:hypothetical protein
LRRWLLFIVAAGLSSALAGEFLGIVPNAAPEDLADRYTVVGVTGHGVLVLSEDSRDGDFAARGGSFLAENPRAHLYYTVRLFTDASRSDLAAVARIIDFDGEEYLVEVEPDAVERFIAVPAMRGRVSLNGWVMDRPAPKLPPVLSDPTIEQLVGRVSPDSVLAFVHRLQDYGNRQSTGDSCKAAAQWIAAKFQAYGCDTVILQDHTAGHAPNVIGIRYGVSGERQPYAIIDGHFDGVLVSPAADDNGSGTASALEACRVTQGFQFQHDLRFIAFSGEEFGLFGSEYYAGQARSQGDSILGVLNFDMIAYEDSPPEDLEVIGKVASPPCEPFCDWFIAIADTYTTLPCNKDMVSDMQSSDHGPFWNNGYLAFCGIEDYWPVNPYYHTAGDSIGAGYNNNDFCTEVIKAGVAALATMGEPVPLNAPSVDLLRKRLDDSTGDNNGRWDAAESVAVFLTLKNVGLVGATNVSARVGTGDPYVTLYDTSADYGDIAGLDTAVNSAPFTMRAAPNTPREHVAEFDLTITSAESTWQRTFSYPIGERLSTDPIPDGPREPAVYWAYDDVDTLYAEHPSYDWVEVNGEGTRLDFAQNDDVIAVDLPASFGPLRYYGQSYSQVSVSADGWIAAGNYTQDNYDNTGLPNASAPRATVFANWDDLYPGYGDSGYVYWHHDSANHRFVVEYDSVAYWNPRARRDKFEVIFYDTTVASPTGDNVIVAQYMTAAGFVSSTVGIQDSTQAIAIQDLFNGTLAHGAAPITAGRAIKYTTATGMAVAEPAISFKPQASRLRLEQNPVSGAARVSFSLPAASNVRIEAFDRSGRKSATLASGLVSAGDHSVTWDTRSVPAGVYFLRLTASSGQRSLKAVVGR